MTKNFVAYRLVIDYSLIIGNNQWLINWLPIDYLLITHWFHWCHWLVMSGLLCGEFKMENIYFEINFCGKNVCANIFGQNLFLWMAGQSQNSQKLEVAKISCTRLSKLCNPNPLYPPPRPLTEKLSISKHYQEPITRSEQLPCVRVTVCSRISLFLERF